MEEQPMWHNKIVSETLALDTCFPQMTMATLGFLFDNSKALEPHWWMPFTGAGREKACPGKPSGQQPIRTSEAR